MFYSFTGLREFPGILTMLIGMKPNGNRVDFSNYPEPTNTAAEGLPSTPPLRGSGF